VKNPAACSAAIAVAIGIVCADASGQAMQFNDVTASSGLSYTQSTSPGSLTSGIAVGDFDGDGLMDVLLMGSDDGVRLMRNNGDGTFTDVTAAALPPGMPNASSAMFVDVNNNGAPDLVMAVWNNGDRNDVSFACYLNVDGVYVLGPSDPDLARAPDNHFGGMAAADCDNDGLLDIVFVHGGPENDGGPGFFLRNDGDGVFSDQTAQFGAGLSTHRRYWAIALADFNGNGLPDLHAAIDFGHDYHAWNNGDGTFTNVSAAVGVSNFGSDMGLAVGDPDGDGNLDIYSTNIQTNVLYMNDGDGYFIDRASYYGCHQPSSPVRVGWGAVFADLDNSGAEDLTFVASVPGSTFFGPGVLWRNNGAGYFSDANAGSGLDLTGYSLIAFDMNGNGALDLLLSGHYSGSRTRFFENVSPALADRHWLIVDLEGTVSNRDGIGAKITATVGARTMVRHMMAGASFVSGPPTYVHFGLGESDVIDQLRIDWPSGRTTILNDVDADQRLEVRETPIGDLDFDGAVGSADLAILLGSWGPCPTGGGSCVADLSGDGLVGSADLSILLGNWGF